MWISPGGNESGGLMQHDSERRSNVNQFAVDFNVIAYAGLRTEVGARLAVNRNLAGRDQFIAMPARSKTGRGEEPIKAHDRES